MMKLLKGIRDRYVINQAWKARIPEFGASEVCRYRIRFSGRVQKVGFRLEVGELAKRLGLSGFCGNLPNGDVEAELQGEEEKILFLVKFMESLVRIRVREKTMEKIPVLAEVGFEKR